MERLLKSNLGKFNQPSTSEKVRASIRLDKSCRPWFSGCQCNKFFLHLRRASFNTELRVLAPLVKIPFCLKMSANRAEFAGNQVQGDKTFSHFSNFPFSLKSLFIIGPSTE